MVAEARTTTTVGTFAYDPATDAWTWSDAVYAIHDFRRGEVVPTSALVAAHQHPEDRHGVRSLLDDAVVTGRTGGGAHAVIDEAKGALMVVYGVDADAAFELLRWYSQHTNVKLRTLAERIVGATGGAVAVPPEVRRVLDETLFDVSVHATDVLATVGEPDTTPGTTPAVPGGAGVAGGGDVPPLRTEVVRLPSATFVHVSGEVDLAAAPALSAVLREATAHTTPPAPVVVDLTEVTHLGPAGVAELLACHRRCRGAGLGLRLVVGPDGPPIPLDDGGPTLFADLVSAAS